MKSVHLHVYECRGHIYLSDAEKRAPVSDLVGNDLPYWVIMPGGKSDIPVKMWRENYWQEVVNHFAGKIQFVQVGRTGQEHGGRHINPVLKGVVNLIDKTSLRDLIRLVYHAEGCASGDTSLMHMVAAVPLPPKKMGPRPGVVIAGGRTGVADVQYPGQTVISAAGTMPCCLHGGCFRDSCEHTDGRYANCMTGLGPGRVIDAIEQYYRGGRLKYLQTGNQAGAAQMARQKLPSVTLVGIDTDHPRAGLLSLRKSMEQLEFARVVFFTSEPIEAPGIDVRIIPRFSSVEDYSRFIFASHIADAIDTGHALITHWDSWVLDGSRWDDAFLGFDYVGAPWPFIGDPNRRVGNGGFCLRSKWLLSVIAEMRDVRPHPEDVVIARDQRARLEKLGMRFADEATAWRFAHEYGGEGRSDPLGFHSVFNFRRFCSQTEIDEILGVLPERMRGEKWALGLK